MNKFLNASSVSLKAYYKNDEEGIELPINYQDEFSINVDFDMKDYDCVELQLLYSKENPVANNIDLKVNIEGQPLLLILEPRKEVKDNCEYVRYHDYQIDDLDQVLNLALDINTRELNFDAWGWINKGRKSNLSICRVLEKEHGKQLIKEMK